MPAMKMIFLSLAFAALSALQASAQEVTSPSVAMLSGLRGVTVKVAVHPTNTALRESLQHSVEAALRPAGVQLFEESPGPDVPTLQIYVLNSPDIHQRSVAVRQPVVLARDPKTTFVLSTWSTEGNGCGAISDAGIRASVLRMVEDFTRDFRAANPR